jgi:hypothetical protein
MCKASNDYATLTAHFFKKWIIHFSVLQS